MEEQEDYGFIYITENLINGKQYIGQKKFRKGHRYYLGSGTLLEKAIKKYGRENFSQDIIEVCGSKEELNEKEIFWISYYNCVEDENFYNLCIGGGSCSGNIVSAETRKKLSEAGKGRILSEENRKKLLEANKGRVASEETKKKMSEAWKTRVVTEETKRKISIASTGRRHTDEAKKKVSDAHKGKITSEEVKKKISNSSKWRVMSEYSRQKLFEANTRRIPSKETREKISKSHMGHTVTEDARKKMSESHTGKTTTAVLKFDISGNFIKEYNSIIEALIEHGLDRHFTGISHCCAGRKKSAHGYIWKYKEI